MTGGPFLRDLMVVLASSFPILLLFRRLRLPPIVGFLVAGIFLGPHALAWVRDPHRVAEIAELGVVLILFFVGLEFPLARLRQLGRTGFLGGSLQMGLTIGALAAVAVASGRATGIALFIGILLSVSSTAVVLPLLKGRDEAASPYAKRFLGVALFQDLAVIPLVLLLPVLAGDAAGSPGPGVVAGRVVVALAGIGLLVFGARFVVPRLLEQASRLGSREGFTATVLLLLLGIVFLGERAGVSAALGAFAAGIVLGESDLVHEVAAALMPLRDILSSVFFVSIGMLLDPAYVAGHVLLVAGVVLVVLFVKTGAAYGALRLSAAVPRTAIRAALPLATVGEFSFVILRAGEPFGLASTEVSQLFLAVAVVTLAATPLLLELGPRLAPRFPDRPEDGGGDEAEAGPLSGHVVIAGYGLNGQNVARVLLGLRIPHVVIDAEADRIAEARQRGSRAVRGDVTGSETLDAAGVARAYGVVVALSDADATRRVVRQARHKSPDARIVVRTRYVAEVEPLRAAGADEVIPEEFETSIEIVTRVLRLYHLPGNVVAAQLRLLRDETYRLLRDPSFRLADGRRLSALMAAGTTELFLVLPDTPADGRTLGELSLEAGHVSVPALLRDGKPFAPPPLEMRVEAGDTLLLVGAHEDLAHAIARLERAPLP